MNYYKRELWQNKFCVFKRIIIISYYKLYILIIKIKKTLKNIHQINNNIYNFIM